jgi:hypothetical protein
MGISHVSIYVAGPCESDKDDLEERQAFCRHAFEQYDASVRFGVNEPPQLTHKRAGSFRRVRWRALSSSLRHFPSQLGCFGTLRPAGVIIGRRQCSHGAGSRHAIADRSTSHPVRTLAQLRFFADRRVRWPAILFCICSSSALRIINLG